MIEIELKYAVQDDLELRRRLTGLQAVAAPIERHVDSYYRHPCRDFAASGEALRIRRINGRPFITYKGPKERLDSGSTVGIKVRSELEWALSPGDNQGDNMTELLVQLGFTLVADVVKRREPFEVLLGKRRVTATIDTVESLGTFAEVECMANDISEQANALHAVAEVAKRLYLGESEPRSYLRMVLEQQQNS